MKVVIQSTQNLYLQGLNRWTEKIDQARIFDHSATAIEFCLQHNLRNVDIVLKFDPLDSQYDVRVPWKASPREQV